MNVFRTALVILALCAALPVRASLSENVLTLAACQARYSALSDNPQLLDGADDAIRFRRDLFAAMLDATVFSHRKDPEQRQELVRFVIQQRREINRLLVAVQFAEDERRSKNALRQVQRLMSLCDHVFQGHRALGA